MFKYEYVEVFNESVFGSKFSEHRIIIDKYAKKGYKYVGFIPVKSDGYGRIKIMDLVFEKQE